MSELFTDQARLALWLEVEVLAAEAWASLGVVATGTPFGICTVAYKASTPFRAPPLNGTPTTGSVVWAATAPARWAAMPAPQMKAT